MPDTEMFTLSDMRKYVYVGCFLIVLALVGITLAIISISSASSSDEPICAVGVSGMSPGIEHGLITSGVWKPNSNFKPVVNKKQIKNAYVPFGDWIW